jgi:hypothetical protein
MTVTKKYFQRKVLAAGYTATVKSTCLFKSCLLPLFATCGLSDFSTKLEKGFNFTLSSFLKIKFHVSFFKAIRGTSSIRSVGVRKGSTVSCQNFGLPSMAS